MQPVRLRALGAALLMLALLVPVALAADRNGGPGTDNLTGTGSADNMTGLGGNDRLSGPGGNDRLNGGTGNDRVRGGAGADTLHSEFNGVDTVDCGPGNDTATVDSGDRVRNCERVRRLQL